MSTPARESLGRVGEGTTPASDGAARAETIAAATEDVAHTSLRVGLALMAIASASDAALATASHVSAATLLEGVAVSLLAICGVARPRAAAALLRPQGRVALLAAVFAVVGAVDTSLQDHYAETTVVVVWIAAIVSSPRWIAAAVGVSVLGVFVDYAAAGHSLNWMFSGRGQDAVANQVVDLCANAALVLAAISLLRRSIAMAPIALASARGGGESLTPALAAVVRGESAGLLKRADPRALIDELSAAEQQVLTLLAAGSAPKQAAFELGVAMATVRSHIAAAKRKTGARTLEQLVGLYAEANLGA